MSHSSQKASVVEKIEVLDTRGVPALEETAAEDNCTTTLQVLNSSRDEEFHPAISVLYHAVQ